MSPSYNPLLVAASVAIAVLASFVTLDLAHRMRSTPGRTRRLWWTAGSLAMGTGIWAMHFVGMQAFSLPITLGYQGGMTLLSWLAAIAASGIALAIAGMGRTQHWQLVVGALTMGCGISAMHYLGMQAMEMSIPIAWNPVRVGLSVLVAVLASATALLLFQYLPQLPSRQRAWAQALAALLMGVAICGMHYIGMSAASFADGAVCLSADALGGPELTALVLITSGLLLASALFITTLDKHLQRTTDLNHSLQESNSDLQRANAELQHRAFADPLTGLPNRHLFEARLTHAMLQLERANHRGVVKRLGLLYVDLDGFKPVNDSFGHAAGDLVLKSASDRLLQQARESDTVARIGGDEFLVLLDDVHHTDDCLAVAERMRLALAQSFLLAGKPLHVTASIGVVLYPEHGEQHQLIANADAAMYAAKRAGGNRCVVFDPHMSGLASDSK
jgi:diguanylate cyclase (GGDEF)-like protein